jgi:hypothetical protein
MPQDRALAYPVVKSEEKGFRYILPNQSCIEFEKTQRDN